MTAVSKNIVVISLILLLCSCGSGREFVIPEPMPHDMRSIPEPKPQKIYVFADALDKQITEQITEFFQFSRHVRNLLGKPKQALNLNAFGEVDNSSWFTNRNANELMSIEEVVRGPDSGKGPDTTAWTIVIAKSEGVTPGFAIRDGTGVLYFIKFDPKGYTGLATGAEVVSTKLFYAAGYFAPENYIVYFHPRILKVGAKVDFVDGETGEKRYMNESDVRKLMSKVQVESSGYYRALASKAIPGRVKGPFKYVGTKSDDPNDIIPHQHRRELRGLRVMAAWLNHFDTKSGNTLTSYVTGKGSQLSATLSF